MRFVILGGGPAGYAAAAAATAIGADVTLVEDVGLGGNATLWDAIPSKTLLSTAGVRATVVRAEALGLAFQHGTPQVDLLRTVAHARYVAAHQSRSIRDRLEGTATHLVSGHARIAEPGLLRVTGATGEREVPYDRLVLATGAAPWEPPFAQVDHQRVFTPRDVLKLRRLPEHLVVVGAGATGCEYAEFFLSCGVRVTLLSARPQVLPAEDRDIAEIVEEAFLARGCELQFDARVADVEHHEDGVAVTTADGRCFDGSHASSAWACAPPRPTSASTCSGIATDERGAVLVDGNGLTSAEGVYAVGDLAGGMMLASTASMQGRHAALHALGAVHRVARPDDGAVDDLHAARGGLRRPHRRRGRPPRHRRRRHEALPRREPARRHLRQQRGHDQARLRPPPTASCSARRSSATARRR